MTEDIRIYHVEAGSLRKFNWGRKGHKHTSKESALDIIDRWIKRPYFGGSKIPSQFVLMTYTNLYVAEITTVIKYTNYGEGPVRIINDINDQKDESTQT